MARLLYITKIARPYIDQNVAFLCTGVEKSDVYNWKKLKRLLSHIKGTTNNTRVIEASSLQDIYTWIDFEYAIHNNIWSHTGDAMVMGQGTIKIKSPKYKLNTILPKYSGVVGQSDYLPYNIWLHMFLKEQGYDLIDNIILQDNKRAIRTDQNVWNYCTGS